VGGGGGGGGGGGREILRATVWSVRELCDSGRDAAEVSARRLAMHVAGVDVARWWATEMGGSCTTTASSVGEGSVGRDGAMGGGALREIGRGDKTDEDDGGGGRKSSEKGAIGAAVREGGLQGASSGIDAVAMGDGR